MKHKTLLLLPMLIALGIGMGSAFGETGEEPVTIITYAVGLAVFIVAGIAYSTIGYRAKLLKALQGEKVEFDTARIGKTIILGVVLGVAATIMSLYNGDTILVSSPQDFFTQVATAMGAIFTIHKLLLSTPKEA